MGLCDPIFEVICDTCGMCQQFFDEGVIVYANDMWGFDTNFVVKAGWLVESTYEMTCPECLELAKGDKDE